MKSGTYLRSAIIALAYAAAGKLGLAIGPVHGFATLVWPPVGIAITSLLIWGQECWPGIFAGALFVNIWTGAPALVALVIAGGNTLEAIVASRLIGARISPGTGFVKIRDLLEFAFVAVPAGAMISSTAGTLAISAAGIAPFRDFFHTWITWTVGDMLGAYLFVPLLVSWRSARNAHERQLFPSRRMAEMLIMFISVAVVSMFVFSGWLHSVAFREAPTMYIILIPLIWAGFRFGERGATVAVVLMSGIAIRDTSLGIGPFYINSVSESIMHLQIFTAVAAIMALFIAISVEGRKRAEQTLLDANEELTSRTRALDDALQEIKRSDKTKDDFIAMLAHELRNPLAPVLTSIELMHAVGQVGEEVREPVQVIERQVKNIAKLLDDLLDVSRISRGKISLMKEHVDARVPISHAAETVRPLMAERGHQFSVFLPESPLWIETDPLRFEQIVVNLLNNAAKYTDPGGMVHLEAQDSHGGVLVAVRDTGIGIPQSAFGRIFETYSQLDKSLARSHGGLGIGLKVVKNLVELQHGSVTVESDGPGRGSTFTIYMPGLPGEPQPA